MFLEWGDCTPGVVFDLKESRGHWVNFKVNVFQPFEKSIGLLVDDLSHNGVESRTIVCVKIVIYIRDDLSIVFHCVCR